MLIGGEAGIGKSRLVGEFLAASSSGRQPAVGHCVDCRAGGLPYGPWIDVVRQLVREAGPVELPELLGEGSTELNRLVPGALRGSPAREETGAASMAGPNCSKP